MAHKLCPRSGPELFHAYAVVYLDRHGKVVRRGIFSERSPTIARGRAVCTKCLAVARSRKNYGRARELLAQKLGPSWR